MNRAYAAMRSGVLVVDDGGPRECLSEFSLECVHAHPDMPETAYAGTYENGVYRTTTGGDDWTRVGEATITQDAVMAVTTNPADPLEVWVGTEPSRVYHSTDGGDSWQHLDGVVDLPSEPQWSFPPRPHTHHVRWIEVDPHDPAHLYVGIEAGALIQTTDRGATWIDHVPSANRDNHTLATHAAAPDRAYSAAGDGYAETTDGGETWTSLEAGLDHRYVWGLAVDPGDPDTVIVSAASGARSAHTYQTADAHCYRRIDGDSWTNIDETGIPTGDGALRSVISGGTTAGELYALNNHGLYRTTDAGTTWTRVDTPWPNRFETETARGLAIV